MISRTRTTRYNSWQAANLKEIKYQSVRCMIFELWFQFKSNQGLKWKLYGELYPERVPRSVNKSSTTLVHKLIHPPPPLSTRDNKRPKFPTSTLTLLDETLITESRVSLTRPNSATRMDFLLEAAFPNPRKVAAVTQLASPIIATQPTSPDVNTFSIPSSLKLMANEKTRWINCKVLSMEKMK